MGVQNSRLHQHSCTVHPLGSPEARAHARRLFPDALLPAGRRGHLARVALRCGGCGGGGEGGSGVRTHVAARLLLLHLSRHVRSSPSFEVVRLHVWLNASRGPSSLLVEQVGRARRPQARHRVRACVYVYVYVCAYARACTRWQLQCAPPDERHELATTRGSSYGGTLHGELKRDVPTLSYGTLSSQHEDRLKVHAAPRVVRTDRYHHSSYVQTRTRCALATRITYRSRLGGIMYCSCS